MMGSEVRFAAGTITCEGARRTLGFVLEITSSTARDIAHVPST